MLLAIVVVPNVIAVLFLSGKVRKVTNDYFTNLYPMEKKDNRIDFSLQSYKYLYG
ncbi:hypothetical protein DVB69_14160 [Sporosarcina sp. BI001-red]|nr:hypothetical protein DVB69_14160 [Sporosarcina sp. BI001-red]